MSDQTRSQHDDGAAPGVGESAEPTRPGEHAKSLLGDAVESTKHKMRSAAEEQKQAGADRMGGFSRAMHGAADELGKEVPGAARYIHAAAQRLEAASSTLEDRSVDEFVDGFSRFARRQPLAAFAGSVLAGFALSRFLKSSG